MTAADDARRVDPRDISWECDRPRFRVHLWTGAGACDEWELPESTADVRQAIAWAVDHRAPGMRAVVHAVVPGGPGLVELARITDDEPHTTI